LQRQTLATAEEGIEILGPRSDEETMRAGQRSPTSSRAAATAS
jgi:hypothetical protein